jgi:hypothetical protein
MNKLKAAGSQGLLALALFLFGWTVVLMFPGVQADTRPVENKIFVALIAGVLPGFVAMLLGLLLRGSTAEKSRPPQAPTIVPSVSDHALGTAEQEKAPGRQQPSSS